MGVEGVAVCAASVNAVRDGWDEGPIHLSKAGSTYRGGQKMVEIAFDDIPHVHLTSRSAEWLRGRVHQR